ncbi:hypothetical protein FACS1894137_12890 [Spirochaetia bacterium]|nr:hypothetical protein FACS1894137_12890 [Spirochaetia bacterium]
MKISIFALIITLVLVSCGSTPTQKGKSEEHLPSSTGTNTFNGIPVEVIGMPYAFDDIRGNHTLDYPIDYRYEKISRNAYFSNFSPLNFRVDKFVYEFRNDGGLIFHTYYSYDRTPSDNGAFYPAKDNEDGTWELQPKYHSHSGGDCSLDFYNDIAVSQAKLNEMRKDPSLGKVYDVLLSVAEDMDYNYPAIGRKATFVTLPNGKKPLKGVCDDYSNLLISRLTAAKINGVSNIKKVSGQNHAWVTLVYKGKTLYLDATWFDKNIIGENGVVDHTPYKDPRNMTFDNEIFTNHNQHHIAGGTRNIGS